MVIGCGVVVGVDICLKVGDDGLFWGKEGEKGGGKVFIYCDMQS